ncbi:MAG: hypothetical protein QG565_657 [Campylobacterota bacterium]|nr:hypothetical protein [Campylobacterota bacterium]
MSKEHFLSVSSNLPIRIYPLSEEEFLDEHKVRDYFNYDLKKQEGKFLYRGKKRAINADKGTLVLFQYQHNIVAQAEFLEVCRHEFPTIKYGVEYNGHFLFDLNTVKYYKQPLTKEEFYKIYSDKPLTRVTHILDNQDKNNQLIKLIDSRI